MKIEKLPSGSYRVRMTVEGIAYSKTYKQKPTQKEALLDITRLSENEKPDKITFQDACEKYIDSKSKVLSPKSIKEYRSKLKNLPNWFTEKQLYSIKQYDVDKLVNILSLDKSPKTVHDIHGFVSSVLRKFNPSMVIYTTLPQKIKSEPYIPSTEDIQRLLAEVKGTMFEVPIVLGCYGMRRSEVCALTVDDVEGNVVHINKALVQDENNNWVLKQTKTTDSTRDIIIPGDIADLIRSQGYVYQGYPQSISNAMKRIQNKLGMPNFSFHKLRHYFASKMLTITDRKTAQELGGWKSNYTMDRVYAHSLKEEKDLAKKKAAELLSQSLFQ